MAGLANAVPVVSNLGELSEPFWRNVGCVQLASNPDPVGLAVAVETVLALSPAARHEMAQSAAALYRDNFSLEQTITRLRTLHTTR
jgi:hypothetical protein